jgi:hypothetical protein
VLAANIHPLARGTPIFSPKNSPPARTLAAFGRDEHFLLGQILSPAE